MNYLYCPNTEGNLLPHYRFVIPRNEKEITLSKRIEGIVNNRIFCLGYEASHDEHSQVSIHHMSVLNEIDLSAIKVDDIMTSYFPFYGKGVVYCRDEINSQLSLYDTNKDQIIDTMDFPGKRMFCRCISDNKVLFVTHIGEDFWAPAHLGVLYLDDYSMNWKIELPCSAFMSFFENKIYVVAGTDGICSLNCLEMETGEIIWEKTFSDWNMEAYRPRANYRFNVRDEIYVYKDLVLVNLELGLLLAINRHTGERAWITENVTGKKSRRLGL